MTPPTPEQVAKLVEECRAEAAECGGPQSIYPISRWRADLYLRAADTLTALAQQVREAQDEKESAQTVYANIAAWLDEHAVKVETHDWAHFKSALANGFRTYAKYLRELSAGRPPFLKRLDEARAAERKVAELEAHVSALTEERDEARAIVAKVNNEVIGSDGYFTTPSCVEAIGKLKLTSNQAFYEKEQAEAESTALRGALEQVEWVRVNGRVPKCLWCDGVAPKWFDVQIATERPKFHRGHTASCLRQQALAPEEK